MARRKKITPFQDYEMPVNNKDYIVGYIRLIDIQLVCMNELSNSAFRLYIMMKSYAKGNSEFSFPHRIYKNFISKQGFTNARQELISHGYLEEFISHKSNRTKNEYKFSNKWRELNKNYIEEIINNRKK